MGKASGSSTATKATQGAQTTLKEAIRQIATLKTDTETLNAIADLYARFLTHKDPTRVVEALAALQDARAFEDHVWRVRALALEAGNAHQHAWLFTVVLLVTYRLRHVDSTATAWAFVQQDDASWRGFVSALVDGFNGKVSWSVREKAALVHFLIQCFTSLDMDAVASEVLKLVSLPMWATALSPSQRALELAQQPKLARFWKKIMPVEAENDGADEPAKKKQRKAPASKAAAKSKSSAASETAISHREKAFVVDLLADFATLLTASPTELKKMSDSDADEKLRYVALTLTLLTDLLSQLPTRRFLEVVLRRKHVLTHLRKSPLVQWLQERRSSQETAALTKQIETLEKLLHFPIDAHSGKALVTLQERKEATTRKIQTLQLAAFEAKYRDTPVETLSIVPVSSIVDRASFKEVLGGIVDRGHRESLEALGVTLGVFADEDEAQGMDIDTLLECFVNEYASLPVDTNAQHIVLPTELDIWSDAIVENSASESSPVYGAGHSVLFPILAVPKLGLQYLNLVDFLARNAELSRVEAAHGIRKDLEAAIRPLNAVRSLARNGETVFRGFSQHAVPLLTAFSITKVDKPAIGETVPATVTGQFDIELDTRHDIAAFDRYQHGEIIYLVTIRPSRDEAAEAMGFIGDGADAVDQEGSGHFAEDFGVLYVRCAQLVQVEDESGNAVKADDDQEKDTARGKGRKRSFQVEIDGAQYKSDLDNDLLGAYEYVNLVVRRDPRTNNFKAILDAISAAQRTSNGSTLPTWLNDLYLGYGDPHAAGFEAIAKGKLQAKLSIPIAQGVFGDASQALSSFDGSRLVDAADKPLVAKDASGPYTFECDVASKSFIIKAHHKSSDVESSSPLRLTAGQAQLVVRGSAEGLTVATGAVGTGKSQALAHLLQNLYQNSKPNEKILVVARSTVVLDQLLEKVKPLPHVDEANIVRLGGGRASKEGSDFSSQGRVDLLLQRRIDMLQEVDAIAKWMERADATKYAGLSSSASYSCENALFFYRFYMKALIDQATQATAVTEDLLLRGYYVERMGSEAKTLSELHTFTARLEGVFGELHRLQAFELLQMPAQRRDVYLMQHARVVAMTSTHAARQFQKLSGLKLQWTSVIVEDAGQIGEVDAFIPLALASVDLKRLVLVGDEAASPVVETPALKSYAHLDSSLFGRLLRLGVPRITLPPLQTAAATVLKTDTPTKAPKAAKAEPAKTPKGKATPSKKAKK